MAQMFRGQGMVTYLLIANNACQVCAGRRGGEGAWRCEWCTREVKGPSGDGD